MKNLILIRHGESIWNLENRFTGWFDVDLTPKGKEEAETAGKPDGKQGKKHQVKSKWYYIFWGVATVSVVAGQIYVGLMNS